MAISPVILLLQLNTLTGDRPIARGSGPDRRRRDIAFGVLLVAVWAPRIVAAAETEGAHDRLETSQRRPILPRGRSWRVLPARVDS